MKTLLVSSSMLTNNKVILTNSIHCKDKVAIKSWSIPHSIYNVSTNMTLTITDNAAANANVTVTAGAYSSQDIVDLINGTTFGTNTLTVTYSTTTGLFTFTSDDVTATGDLILTMGTAAHALEFFTLVGLTASGTGIAAATAITYTSDLAPTLHFPDYLLMKVNFVQNIANLADNAAPYYLNIPFDINRGETGYEKFKFNELYWTDIHPKDQIITEVEIRFYEMEDYTEVDFQGYEWKVEFIFD